MKNSKKHRTKQAKERTSASDRQHQVRPSFFSKIKISKRSVAVLLVIAVAVIAFWLWQRGFLGQTVRKSQYNLILVSIDTVRANYLELYNPKGVSTPNLNRIAQKSLLFTDAISQVPLTLPSHSTMLTGTYPMKHLVRENTTGKLSDSALTLAEVLKSAGYHTAGFVGSIVLESSVGIAQGFDHFDDVFTTSDLRSADLGGVQKTADEVYGSFQRWFQDKPQGKYFAFVHFYDPHSPYEPPKDFRPDSGKPEELYKGELRYVDSVIGKMYDELDAQGVWKDTVLVITGDHGEMFGEHGETGHGYYVYEPATNVPLVVKVAGLQREKKIGTPVEIADLMPTLLDLLTLQVPKTVQGESFYPLFNGKKPAASFAYSESYTASRNFNSAPVLSIQDASFKYIESPKPELYDLHKDQQEKTNLYKEQQAIARKMKLQLDVFLKKNTAKEQEVEDVESRSISSEQAEQLAALGYIGESGSGEIDPSRDAKDYIRYWTDLNRLGELMKLKRYQECLTIAQEMKRADAFPKTAQIIEARAFTSIGKPENAIQSLEALLQQDPSDAQVLNAIAQAYEKAGQTDKALMAYEGLLEKHNTASALRKYVEIQLNHKRIPELISFLGKMERAGKWKEEHYPILGETYLTSGDLEKARFYLERSIQTNPRLYRSYILLSVITETQRKPQEALALLESVQDRFQDPDFLVQLGLLYHKTGNRRKEFETFRRMAELHKQDPRGYFYLAKVMLEAGDFKKVIQLAEFGLNLHPSPQWEVFGNELMADAYLNLGLPDKAQFFREKARRSQS